jgi:putative FmdB family regulatory protein
MPIYDYVCQNCGKRFDIYLSYSEYGSRTVACLHCGSENVRRRLGRVRVAKSEDSRLDDMSDDFSGMEGLEDDPKAMGRMMRKMGREMGEDLPPEFDDVVDRLESGQSPEDIEQALPDLGGDNGISGPEDDDF